jgi:hypothetical protein
LITKAEGDTLGTTIVEEELDLTGVVSVRTDRAIIDPSIQRRANQITRISACSTPASG